MRRRQFIQFVSALVLAPVLSYVPAPAIAQDKTNVSFRLDWSIYGTHAPFYLALKEGLYEREGLNVTIGEGQGSATVAKLIAQGADPIGFVDFGTLARSVEQGMPLKGVMRLMSDVTVIISHADNPIKEPKELEGKIVAFAPAESTAQIFPALLANQGIDPNSVSVLTPAVGAKNAVFLQKRADAIPAHVNVQVAQLEALGATVSYFKFSDFGVSQMNNGIVVNTGFLDQNPDAVRGFLKATVEAFEIAEKEPERAVDALISALPEHGKNRSQLLRQLELGSGSLKTKYTEDKPLGWIDDRDWEETQNLLVTYGGMSRKVPVEQLSTNEFLPEQ
ncbi:ABC transporter substrate-binding protein [Pseudochelatococcus sp. B33]